MRTALAVVMVAACSSDGGGGGAPVYGANGPFFDTQMFFDQDVSGTSPASNSDAIISSLRAAGGWGNGDKMQIDFSLVVLGADASTPKKTFTPNQDFYRPDCDNQPVPIPSGGNIEGGDGYACDGGDCHLLVFDADEHALYEMYKADLTGDTFSGGCLAVWHTQMSYGDTLRGDQCTSADAAGFPMSPLLFTADEVAAGSIDHAIRFIVPNDRIQRGYVRPATHGTDTDGDANAPYYGVHLRLRADYPIESLPSAGAKVVARAMQKFGMYHADGGNIALTAQSDKYSTATWDGLLDAHDLVDLAVEDFDVIDHGAPIELTLDCNR